MILTLPWVNCETKQYVNLLIFDLVMFQIEMYCYALQHGESEQNLEGRIGGDSSLSHRGRQYADTLAKYIQQQDIQGLRVWTSWLRRTIETVEKVPAPQERWKALNEIDAVSL